MKTCTKCGELLSLNNFRIYKRSEKYKNKSYVSTVCTNCINLQSKEYKSKNKSKIKISNKRYRKENREKLNAYNKHYELVNKEKMLEVRKNYQKLMRKSSTEFRLRNNFSRSIAAFLRRNNHRKNKISILQYLPYTIQELKDHLEKQFESWMTWQNWGKYDPQTWNDNNSSTWTWQIDHIIPQSILPYTSMSNENFKKCWSLDNLRPLSSKQNVLDGTNRTRHTK